MKTLHITNAWHPSSGGIRTFYNALLEAANTERHLMRLIVPAERSAVEKVGEYGRIYHVAAPPAPFSPSYRILYPHLALLPGGEIHRILVNEQPDLVDICDKFTMNYLGGLLRVGLLPGIKFRPAVVGTSCERLDQTVCTYAFGGAAARRLASTYLRWLYFPLADHHIAVSSFVADELRAVADGHKVDRGVWIGDMGVDARTFSSRPREEQLRGELLAVAGGDDGTRLLVYAGRLAPEKNIPLLFQTLLALAESPEPQDYRLLMVGSGDMRMELEEEADSTVPGLVHFVGHRRDASELARLLACCDAFVHPNPNEPFGIAPLEAMAAGVPLVAPNSGGVTTYANKQNAWLAAPEPAAFAQAVAEVFANPAERAARVERARRTAESRAWPLAAARYLCLYRELHARVRRHAEGYSLDPAFVSTRSAAG
jgi:alpha-1,6-mannosyltransferase